MEINGVPFDKAQAVHALALAYAEGVFRNKLSKGEKLGSPEDCADRMYKSYIRAFAHLSEKSDQWIAQQLDKP